jgi:hypothetical protein
MLRAERELLTMLAAKDPTFQDIDQQLAQWVVHNFTALPANPTCSGIDRPPKTSYSKILSSQ